MNNISCLYFLKLVNREDHPIFEKVLSPNFHLMDINNGKDLLVKFKSGIIYHSPLTGIIKTKDDIDEEIYLKKLTTFFESLNVAVKNKIITEEERLQYVNMSSNINDNYFQTPCHRKYVPILFEGLIDNPEYIKMIYHYGFNFNNKIIHIDEKENVTYAENILHLMRNPETVRMSAKFFGADIHYKPTYIEETEEWSMDTLRPKRINTSLLPPIEELGFIRKPHDGAAPIHKSNYQRSVALRKGAISMMEQLDKDEKDKAQRILASKALERYYRPEGRWAQETAKRWGKDNPDNPDNPDNSDNPDNLVVESLDGAGRIKSSKKKNQSKKKKRSKKKKKKGRRVK